MADKLERLEIRFADRIIYSQLVQEMSLDRNADGAVLLSATEQHGTPTVTLAENPLIPPPPAPGAPDGDDEVTPGDTGVIERVHTGDRDPAAEETKSKAKRGGKGVDGPTGTAVSGDLATAKDKAAADAAKAAPHGTVIDGVEHPCECGDATAPHEIDLPGKGEGDAQ